MFIWINCKYSPADVAADFCSWWFVGCPDDGCTSQSFAGYSYIHTYIHAHQPAASAGASPVSLYVSCTAIKTFGSFI